MQVVPTTLPTRYATTRAAYRPQASSSMRTTAGTAAACGYYPQPAATAGYAPLQSYRVTPAGGEQRGGEAYANYGQPTAVNYVPPAIRLSHELRPGAVSTCTAR